MIDLAPLIAIASLVIGLLIGWAMSGRVHRTRWTEREALLQAEGAAREAAISAELERARGELDRLLRDRRDLQSDRDESRSLEEKLEPLRSALDALRRQSAEAATDRATADAAIKAQIEGVQRNYASLEDATKKLVVAMTQGKSRGQWGEMQLEQLLSHSGLVEGVHYRRQDTRAGENGQSRPDIVIQMPAGTEILVDAKFPFDAYWAAVSADDPHSDPLMRKHAEDVLARAKELAAKRYSDTAISPDFVVMFLPLESLLQSALAADGALLERTFQSQVVLATPTTMLALLRTIAFGYQRNDLAANAERIQQVGSELLHRLGLLSEHITAVRKGLDQAVRGYNSFIGSYESRVLVSAREMKQLGVPSQRSLEAPDVALSALRESAQPSIPTGDDAGRSMSDPQATI